MKPLMGIRLHSLPLRHLVLLAGIAVAGCDCEDDKLQTDPPISCDPDFPCETGFEYRLGACRESRCQVDSDCCPGQKCNASAGFCADQLVTCTTDEQCSEKPGQVCIEFRGMMACGYPNAGNTPNAVGTQSCLADTDCDLDRSCFNSRCVTVAPCEGGCPEGRVCDIDSQECFEAIRFESCAVSCGDGQMLVLTDPDSMSGPLCCEPECVCTTLPPVRGGQVGWYASLALTQSDVLVSAYDPVFGDLVVSRFDGTGRFLRAEYVDGFPATGPLVGDPNGPRGGRADLGEDVGTHTAIAIDNANVAHIAYRDEDNGTLKYANNTGGNWKTSVVDDQGDTGLYTSIRIGSDGRPRIAYMMKEGTVPGDSTPRSALKLATGNTAAPGSPADWTIEIVESRPLPPPICGGGCAAMQACVSVNDVPTCVPTTTGCSMCGSDQACVTSGGSPKCEDKINPAPLEDLPEGVGLFSSLVLTSTDSPLVAYYDRTRGDLRMGFRGNAGFESVRLDGNDSMLPSDVGQHASIALDASGAPAVAYYDATQDDLVYLEVRTRNREVVDDGVSAPDLRLVGADASLVFDAGGRPAIAYQDPTNIDLLYARRLSGGWSTEVLHGAAPASMERGIAAGFYVSQARRDDTAFIANVDVTFNAQSDLVLTLQVFTKPLD